MSLNNYFGIDFGTTSCATVGYTTIDSKEKLVQYGDEEGRPVPSVVAIDKKTGEVYTGRDAWDKKMELSESCEYISSVKTVLDQDWTRKIAGKEWTPVKVAAELFKSLKENVRDRSRGLNMDYATVAIPVGFSPKKRARLREAAKMAGIEIQAFVSEPTAAFFANYAELRSSSIVAVFDWGGGTLDVSIIKNEKGKIYELATTGMNVAGDDIDKKIAIRMHKKFSDKKVNKLRFDEMPSSAQDMMLVKSERAKRLLSDDDYAAVSINNYGPYGVCRGNLDYDWFVDIVKPEVDAAMDCLKKAIEQSGVGLVNIDKIVLVGGSSNLRPLVERMEEMYGDKLFFPKETMWNVGLGAADLAVSPGDYRAGQSIGIVLSDGNYFELLSPDTPLLDWSRECRFGIVDTSREMRLVFSGSRDIDQSGERYRSINVPGYRFLQEQISITAMVDRDMVFKVVACSSMRPREYKAIWEYSQLKCYYSLPEKLV